MTSKDLGKLLNLFGPDGKAWTQNTFAKTATDRPTNHRDKDAAKWCLWGGCIKVGIDMHDLKLTLIEAQIIPINANGEAMTVVVWNDSRKWEEVRSGLMKAMIFLKEREAK